MPSPNLKYNNYDGKDFEKKMIVENLFIILY